MRSHSIISIAILLTLTSSALAQRDYVEEIGRLSSKEEAMEYFHSLTESQLLEMGNQCYIEGMNEMAIASAVFSEGLLPIWRKTKGTPNSEIYLPIIEDEQLHPGWRACVIEAVSARSANWAVADFFKYIDLAFDLLKDSRFDETRKQGIPTALQSALAARMKSTGKIGDANQRQEEVEALHERIATIIRYLADFLKNNPNGPEKLLRYCVYALGRFGGIDYPPSASLNKTKAAIDEGLKALGLVISEGNYPSDVAIAVLRELYNFPNIVSMADIEKLRKSKNFAEDPKALRSLEYWIKNLEKKQENLSGMME